MEFRKTTSAPSASGLPDAIYFTKTSTGKFDLYIATQTGDRATLDRVAMEMTVAGTPPASPRRSLPAPLAGPGYRCLRKARQAPGLPATWSAS